MTGPVDIPPLPSPPPAVDERRWPAWLAFFTVGILPATTARRTTHVRPASALLVHLLAAAGTAAVLFFLHAWDRLSGPASLGEICAQMQSTLRRLGGDMGMDLANSIPWAIDCALGIEFACVLGALLCTPWGAADEPLVASIGNAVRRAWLHTPHILLVVLLCGSLGVFLVRAWEEADHAVMKVLASPLILVTDYPAARDHEIQKRAFYIRHGKEVGVGLCFAGGAWWLWSLLRFIGTPRRPSPVPRLPTCENCGYNLTGITLDRRCPECGEPTVLSLGPDVRAMTPWQRYRPLGRLTALWRCLGEAICRPKRFGRQIPSYTDRSDHRWVLAAVLPVLFLVGWLGAILCEVVVTDSRLVKSVSDVLWRLGPIVGFFLSVAAVVFALLTAGLVGLVCRARAGQNFHAGTMQAACYASAFLVLWSVVAVGFIAYATAARPFLLELIPRQYQGEWITAGFLVLPNILGFLGYFWLVARIMAGMRYANR